MVGFVSDACLTFIILLIEVEALKFEPAFSCSEAFIIIYDRVIACMNLSYRIMTFWDF